MAASTTFHAHMGDDKVVVLANLEHLEPDPEEDVLHWYWSLEITGYAKTGGSATVILFMSPGQLKDMANELRLASSMVESHAWMANDPSYMAPASEHDSDA